MPSVSPTLTAVPLESGGLTLAGLRAATRLLHDRIEATGAAARILDPGVTRDGYRDFLLRTLSVLDPVEAWLERAAAVSGVADPAGGGRRDALRADIAALDGDVEQAPAPLAGLNPSAGAVLGVLYVLEGSALGGAMIARHLHRRWGDAATLCTRFHGGEGGGAAGRWAAFLGHLSTLDGDPAGRAAAETAAVALFGAFLAAYSA